MATPARQKQSFRFVHFLVPFFCWICIGIAAAQHPTAEQVKQRFHQETIGDLGVVRADFSESSPGDPKVTWIYRPKQDFANTNANLTVAIYYEREFDATAPESEQNWGNHHQVSGWPIGHPIDGLFKTEKGHYQLDVYNYSGHYSTAQLQQYADKVFAYALPKISGSGGGGAGDGGNAGAGDTGQAGGATGRLSRRERMKRETLERLEREREEAIRQAQEEWKEIDARIAVAQAKAGAAAGEIREEGKQIAELEGNTVAGSIQLDYPSRSIPVFQGRDQHLGIGLVNGSTHEIRNVRLSVFAQTSGGRVRLGKEEKIEFIQGGGLQSVSLAVKAGTFKDLIDGAERNNQTLNKDLLVTLKYDIVWSKSHKTSESKEDTWTNALNLSIDGAVSEEEQAGLRPPEVRIEPVDRDGNPLPDDAIIANRETYIRFTVIPADGNGCLASYHAPVWNPNPQNIRYSRSLDQLDSRSPGDLADQFAASGKSDNPRFSGELYSQGKQFYARIIAPSSDVASLRVRLPLRFSSDLHLRGDESSWDETEPGKTFQIAAVGSASEDLSAILGIEVALDSLKPDLKAVIIQSKGRIGRFNGTLVTVQLTDPGWQNDLVEWQERNSWLEDNVLLEGDVKAVASTIGDQTKDLGAVLSFAFTAQGIMQAESEADVMKETGKGILGMTVPGVGPVMHLLEKGKAFEKRVEQEDHMLSLLNKNSDTQQFEIGTMYTSVSQVYGVRMFFTREGDVLYGIYLGETSF
ncbi:hypothetical protein JXO52_02535 [bacterium]|nr:hypothetical protein [bacterium]